MRAWCGFATLCAIGLLGGDAIVGASIGKVAFHVALLIVNFVCYVRERGDGMTKREFLDTVFALAPNEANAIMDAFDEYVDSNEPHWHPVTEGLPKESGVYDVTTTHGKVATYVFGANSISSHEYWKRCVIAWKSRPEPYKGVME